MNTKVFLALFLFSNFGFAEKNKCSSSFLSPAVFEKYPSYDYAAQPIRAGIDIEMLVPNKVPYRAVIDKIVTYLNNEENSKVVSQRYHRDVEKIEFIYLPKDFPTKPWGKVEEIVRTLSVRKEVFSGRLDDSYNGVLISSQKFESHQEFLDFIKMIKQLKTEVGFKLFSPVTGMRVRIDYKDVYFEEQEVLLSVLANIESQLYKFFSINKIKLKRKKHIRTGRFYDYLGDTIEFDFNATVDPQKIIFVRGFLGSLVGKIRTKDPKLISYLTSDIEQINLIDLFKILGLPVKNNKALKFKFWAEDKAQMIDYFSDIAQQKVHLIRKNNKTLYAAEDFYYDQKRKLRKLKQKIKIYMLTKRKK